MISIIVGFRDRDPIRVINFLNSISRQSFSNLELIFCDYGSNKAVIQEIETLISKFHFVKYIYCDTRGQFWNRAHALNIGANFAKYDKLLFADIDLIFSDEVISKLSDLDTENIFYTFQCFYTNHKFDIYVFDSYLIQNSKINYVGLCFVSKSIWNLVGGYDEYFMYWGAEDDDFYSKLHLKGVENKLLDIKEYPIIHQWHDVQKMINPTPWYLDMVFKLYSLKNIETQHSRKSFGNLFTTSERLLLPPFQHLSFIEIDLFSDKLYQFNIFLNTFFDLNPGTFGKFTFNFPTNFNPTRKDLVVKFVNKIFRKVKFNYSINKIDKENKIHSFRLWNEFIMLFVGRSRDSLKDYYVEIDEYKAVLYFVKC